MTWNPWVGSDCDTGVYVNLGATDTRAVCIGVNSTAPTATASGVSSTSVTLTNSGTTSMGPTQTGIVAGCTQYYTVQAGDSCAAIDAQFSITFDQFYAWNPAGTFPSSIPLPPSPSSSNPIPLTPRTPFSVIPSH